MKIGENICASHFIVIYVNLCNCKLPPKARGQLYAFIVEIVYLLMQLYFILYFQLFLLGKGKI